MNVTEALERIEGQLTSEKGRKVIKTPEEAVARYLLLVEAEVEAFLSNVLARMPVFVEKLFNEEEKQVN